MREDWRIKAGSTMVADGVARDVFTRWGRGRVLSVLDVGSGNGRFIVSLPEGNTVVAADRDCFLSPEARRRISDFVKMDAGLPWPFDDRMFDAVTAWNVVEHVSDPIRFSTEASRVLKPDGLLFLSMPNVWNLRNRFYFFRTGDMYRFRGRGSHVTILTKMLFQKVFLTKFTLLERGFITPEPPVEWLRRFPFLASLFPLGELSGKTVYFVLQKK